MLDRKYAAHLSSSDSLHEGGSIHSLEDEEAKLTHIEGSPYHRNLEPLARPKKRPPKRSGTNDAYMSPQPWMLDGPNRSIQEDPLDTSLVASSARANELRVTPGLSSAATMGISMPMSSAQSNASGLRGSHGGAALPQLMVTSLTSETKSCCRSEPTQAHRGNLGGGGGPRHRGGTLPPSAVQSTLRHTRPPTASPPTKALHSAPQLRNTVKKPILPPSGATGGRRRSSSNTGPAPPRAAPPAAAAQTPPLTVQKDQGASRRVSTDGPVKRSPSNSRRPSGAESAGTSAPVHRGSQPTSVNGRAPPSATSEAPKDTRAAPEHVGTLSDTVDLGKDDKLLAAVERFNGRISGRNNTAASASKPPTRSTGTAAARSAPSDKVAPPIAVPSTCEQLRDRHAPVLEKAAPSRDDAFLFEEDRAGTMSASYFGVDDLSPWDKKGVQEGTTTVLYGQRSPPLADMLKSIQLCSGPAPASQKNSVKTRANDMRINAKASQDWAEPPAQMPVNRGHVRRSMRRSSRPEAQNGSTTPHVAADDAAAEVKDPKNSAAVSRKRVSAPPPSVPTPSAAEHKPCVKAINAKRLPPPTTAPRKQATLSTSSHAGSQAPRRDTQRVFPERPRDQSVADADPNDKRLVTLDDIWNNVLEEDDFSRSYGLDL